MVRFQQHALTLGEIAEQHDFPFPTLMSYRKGYVTIKPDVKVKGKSKLLFSPRQQAKFLAARVLFKARLHGKVVQAFLKQVMDGCDEDGTLFLKQTKPEHEPFLRITWLVAYDADHPEDPYFVPSEPITTPDEIVGARTLEEFSNVVDLVADSSPEWRGFLITLGAFKSEVWGHINPYKNCIDYPLTRSGRRVAEALAGFRRSNVTH